MNSEEPALKKSPTRSTARSTVVKPSALVMQRQLEESTKALEIEKRKHMELQEEHRKTAKLFEEEKEQLNVLLRATNSNSVMSLPIKASNMLHHSNKLYSQNESVLARIKQLRDEITVLRRERQKHVVLIERLNEDLKQLQANIQQTDARIDSVRTTNDFVKAEILSYRNRTINDIKDFKQSFGSLTQNYFSERKQMENNLKRSRSGEASEIQINALPLMKERLRRLIAHNRQKIQIVSDYKRACTEVAKMFELMCEYKGKDDIPFIAREFVEKENIIYKLEEYIDQLESRLAAKRQKQNEIVGEAANVEGQLDKANDKLIAKRSKKDAVAALKQSITDTGNEIANIERGFQQLAPAFQRALIKLRESRFNMEKDNPEQVRINFSLLRGNLLNVLGEIEKYIVLVKPPNILASSNPLKDDDLEHDKEKSEKPPQPAPLDDTENPRNELLDYGKLRQLAIDIIERKSSLPQIRRR